MNEIVQWIAIGIIFFILMTMNYPQNPPKSNHFGSGADY